MIKEDSKAMATNSEINKRYGNLHVAFFFKQKTAYEIVHRQDIGRNRRLKRKCIAGMAI